MRCNTLKSILLSFALVLAAAPAGADPISLVAAMPPGTPQYSLFFIDVSRLRDQTPAQAKAALESQVAPFGITPAYVNADLNATPIAFGPVHFGVFELYSYNRESIMPSVEEAPLNLTLDRGVKNLLAVNFRTPVLVGDPTDVGHAVHIHFDEPMKTFGMMVDATAAIGGLLITDALRFEAQTDTDGDGLLETVTIERTMTVDAPEFVGVDVPTGFTDLLVTPLGGMTQAFIADRFAYVPMPPVAPVGAAGAVFSFAPPSPNPSSGAVAFRYTLPADGAARAEVYGTDGRLVRTLLDGQAGSGEGVVTWDGRNVAGQPAPAGVYFVKMTQGGRSITSRVAIVR